MYTCSCMHMHITEFYTLSILYVMVHKEGDKIGRMNTICLYLSSKKKVYNNIEEFNKKYKQIWNKKIYRYSK